ncbi:DUF3991 domain-containing protein [Paenibacillus hunanensis]|uniref:DUF3991 domain-containing protein n=1 Tax=Paenibacillus hunanensis TaxID=539262 RepID=UPI003D6A917A
MDIPQKAVVSYTKEIGQLIFPYRAPNFRRVAWYLSQVRGIAPEIMSLLMHEHKLYQQDKTGNCLIFGYDKEGDARCCLIRSTTLNKPFKLDREYSDKSYPFYLCGYPDSKRVYVCKSPIDAANRVLIEIIQREDWKTA